jgi:hypothetical protein
VVIAVQNLAGERENNMNYEEALDVALEAAIEDIVAKHFGLHWSFKVARELPEDKHSKALMAVKQLVKEKGKQV